MAWIDGDTLATAVKQALGKPAFETDSPWPAIATAAAENAKQTIVAALAGRGYTAAQAEEWDAAATYQRDIGLYFAFTDAGAGSAPETYNPAFVNAKDRRAELLTVTLTAGGEVITPDNVFAPAPSISGGTLTNDTDLFRLPSRRCRW